MRGAQTWTVEAKYTRDKLPAMRTAAAELAVRARHVGGDLGHSVLVFRRDDTADRMAAAVDPFTVHGCTSSPGANSTRPSPGCSPGVPTTMPRRCWGCSHEGLATAYEPVLPRHRWICVDVPIGVPSLLAISSATFMLEQFVLSGPSAFRDYWYVAASLVASVAAWVARWVPVVAAAPAGPLCSSGCRTRA